MTGWKERLRAFDDLAPDVDVYARAEKGPRHDLPDGPSGMKRLAAAVVAFAVFGAAAVFAWLAFLPSDEPNLVGPIEREHALVVSITEPGAGQEVPNTFNENKPRPTMTATFDGVALDGTPVSYTWCQEPGVDCSSVTLDYDITLFQPVPAGTDVIVEGDASDVSGSFHLWRGEGPSLSMADDVPVTPGSYELLVDATFDRGEVTFSVGIKVIAARPASPARVPDLVGLQISDAIQAAEEAGLTVGTIQELDASKLGEPGADDVVNQDPAPGTTVDAGAEISVSVTAFVHSGPYEPDRAIDSADSLLVVFSEGRKGVFVVSGKGDVGEQVVAGNVDDIALSPGGDQVAYVDGTGIWLQAVAGGAPDQLTTDSSDGSPTWSPDGTTIAFSRERSSGSDIYVVASNGESEPRRLTEDSVVAFTPAWSPDGQQIAFVGYPSPVGGAAPDPTHLYVMASNGSNVRVLPGDDAAQPAWSPTGDRLAFVNSWSSIALIDLDGSDMHEIYNAAPGPALSPVWAPDGQHLAFVAGRTVEDLRVFAIAQDGTALTPVTGEGLAALDVVWAE